MAGKVLNLDTVYVKDTLGCRIADFWMQWNMFRQPWIAGKEELRKYVYATDTTTTTNSKLPWKNKTTIPKLCQIRDNLFANYMAMEFPSGKSKWLAWEADDADSNSKQKRDAILKYMSWVVSQDRFKTELSKCVLDYIDYGNAFGTVEWMDERQSQLNSTAKFGYVGPVIRRISPLDIVFNPTAPSFLEAPKIVRSIVSMGEVKKILESLSTDDTKEAYQTLFDYLVEVRTTVRSNPGADLKSVDAFLQVDGFTNFRSYLESDYCEILTFYGDIFNWETKELLQNYKIMVVDRHKIIYQKANPSYFGYPPIFHVGWRPRQDNLWAMGPLDNLVGLQYRLDHIENLKSDVFDLHAFPPIKVKGYVEDFEWGPMVKIVTSEEGDVEIMSPQWNILSINTEIEYITRMMEEMAGAPKEALGFRTPGEKTAYEVSRLENAASRIFTNKGLQFDEQFVEKLLNGGVELARRNLSSALSVPVLDEFGAQTFATISPMDLVGAGRIRPIGAKHFAQRAELVQNINNFYLSGAGQDPEVRQHISAIGIAKMTEELLDWKDYRLVLPYVRISEQADAQRLAQASQEHVAMEAQTPSGLTPDDHDPEVAPVPDVSQAVQQQLGSG